MSGGALVTGVGNPWRSDDAVGHHVARRVAERDIPHVTVVADDLDGAALLEVWRDAATIIVVDATSSDATPGTISRFDAVAGPIPADTFAASTHMLGVAQAVELARTLGRLPRRLVVIGVEGAVFNHGETLSPDVAAAVEVAADRVIAEIDAPAG